MASTAPKAATTSSCPSPSKRSIAAAASCGSATALDAILTRHDYPAPVARLLGEAVVLAALIGSSLKFEGRFILQTQTDGPVNLIVVDLDAPDGLRGYARFDADAVLAGRSSAARPSPASCSARAISP